MIGRRFYIYAARKWAGAPGTNGHDNGFALSSGPSPGPRNPPDPQSNGLPTGVIVGSAVIAQCVKNCEGYEWHLTNVKRYKRPRKVKRQPQPVWFTPF